MPTVYSHVWPDTGTNQNVITSTADPSQYSLGTIFTVSSNITLYGARIWNPGQQNVTIPRRIRLYAGATLQYTETGVNVNKLKPGWNEIVFTTPQALVTGTSYTLCYDVDGGTGNGSQGSRDDDYGVISSSMSTPPSKGPFNFATDGGVFGGLGGRPTSTFSSSWYGVDVLYDPQTITAPEATIVQGWTQTSGLSGTNPAITFGTTPTAGNRIIVVVAAGATMPIPAGYERAATAVSSNELSMFTKISNGTETGFNATLTASAGWVLQFAEVSGLLNATIATAVDKVAQSNVGSGSVAVYAMAGNTGTLAQADEFIVAAVSNQSTTADLSGSPYADNVYIVNNNGFNGVSGRNNDIVSSVYIGVTTKNVHSTAAVECWTCPIINSLSGNTNLIVTFKVATTVISYSDDFNRADGAPGAKWIEHVAGSYLINSNKLQRTVSGDDYIEFAQAMTGPDHFVEADVSGANTSYLVLHARFNAGTCYMAFATPGGSFNIGTATAYSFNGVQASGGSQAAFGNSFKLRLEVFGNTIKVYANGVLQVSWTDSSITTGNGVGLNATNVTTNTFDNFLSGPITGAKTIAEENALTGSPGWFTTAGFDTDIVGFPTAMSVEAGASMTFKVSSKGVPYAIDIYRLGYYNGDGARQVTTLTANPGTTQADGTLRSDGVSGVGGRDCAAWTVTDTWAVPATATHGVHVALLRRNGETDWFMTIPFVVTNDRNRAAKVKVKLNDMTWHAYNGFGIIAAPTSGKSIYSDQQMPLNQSVRAWSVSYDRPLMILPVSSDPTYIPLTHPFNGELPIWSWLERNGYDVGYVPSLDLDVNSSLLNGSEVVVSCGHDEYWSQNVRNAWDAALAGGASAIVASGNTMLWRTRIGTSGDSRRMYCYKDSHTLDGTGSGTDPVAWTGTWRDTRWAGRKPENISIGTLFLANGTRNDEIIVPFTYKTQPLWRNTTVAALSSGAETLKTDCLGFEWDTWTNYYANSMKFPPGLIWLSEASLNIAAGAANENGSTYTDTVNPALHHVIAFPTRVSDAFVINFGTTQYGWGLSDFHCRGTTGENTTMKQAMVNVLADMDVQPATLQSGLTAATKTAWTFATVTSIDVAPATIGLEPTQSVQVKATATWSNGLTSDITDQATWTTNASGVATVVNGSITAVTVGTATITATMDGQTDTCVVTVALSTAYDTFKSISEVYTGIANGPGPPICVGTWFRPEGAIKIQINGVRWWRTVTTHSQAPIAYACNKGNGVATVSKASPNGAAAPASARWETILFDTPLITAVGPAEYRVWVWMPGGGYPATPGYFNPGTTGAVNSLGGLFENVTVGGVYSDPPLGTNGNGETNDAFGSQFYWVDPLISLPTPDAPVAPVIDFRASKVLATLAVAPADNGTAISDYKWEWRSNGGAWNTWVHGASTSLTATVQPVTPYTNIDVRVSAVNANGTGPASPASNVVVPYGADELLTFTNNQIIKFTNKHRTTGL